MDAPGSRQWAYAALAAALTLAIALLSGLPHPPAAKAAGGYFAARGQEVTLPALQVFLTWDPQTRTETLTVQPRFEGSARDFVFLVPTPTRPKLQPMPRDLFRHLAVFTRLKRRAFPESKLLPPDPFAAQAPVAALTQSEPRPAVEVLETGTVGTLDYRIVSAARAAELFKWLKDNQYQYTDGEAALNAYVQKRWVFTVLKIDPTHLRKTTGAIYVGAVTPMRFQFTSDKLVYPLLMSQVSVKDRADVLFYVQAPFKADLPGDLSYQHAWIPMLQAAGGKAGGLPGKGADWLAVAKPHLPALLQRGRELGFTFTPGQQPRPNRQGHTPTTLEWAKRLTAHDFEVLRGAAPYSEAPPDVDDGFSRADLNEPQRAEAIYRVIRRRLDRARHANPQGHRVRHAHAEDVQELRQLATHLHAGQFLTKFRKVFTRAELAGDLEFIPARLGPADDTSEYEEALSKARP
jgi:hypothetical protein